jgi:hypothetical protein
MGHFACNCRAPRREQQWRIGKEDKGSPGDEMSNDEEERGCYPCQPEPRDKADSWLRVVAEEDDEVKNMILQDLVGKNKDFLNA